MKITYTILIFMISVSIFAQDEDKVSEMRVVGSGEYLKTELIDKNIVDANFEICAGLMIQTDLTGLSYKSNNQIVKVNKNQGEDILFLSPSENVVKIFKTGYKPLQIILSEYDVHLKSGQMWKLDVTGDKKHLLIPVSFVTNIKEPSIYIDGEFKGNGRVHKLTSGLHELRIEKEGHIAIVESIEVSNEKMDFKFDLKEVDLVGFTITSTPRGAKVYLNGADLGVTPKSFFKYPNKYDLRLSKSGYLDKELELDLKAIEGQAFNYSLEKNSGNLELDITPRNATVMIDREVISSSSEIEIGPGTHKIEIEKEGYFKQNHVIDIKKGEVLRRSYTLKQQTGKLLVSVQPLDATVYLIKDGVEIMSWVGMKQIKDLGAGNYTIGARASGYQDDPKIITIIHNGTTREEIVLDETKEVIQTYTQSYNSYSAPQSDIYLGFGILYDTNIDNMGIGMNLGIGSDEWEVVGEYSYGVLLSTVEINGEDYELSQAFYTGSINYYYSYGFYLGVGAGMYSVETENGITSEEFGYKLSAGMKMLEDDMMFMELSYHAVENPLKYEGSEETIETVENFGVRFTFGYNFSL